MLIQCSSIYIYLCISQNECFDVHHVGVLFGSDKTWAGIQSHLPVFPVRRDHRLSSHQEQTGSLTCYQRATALHVPAHLTEVPTTLNCFVSVYV